MNSFAPIDPMLVDVTLNTETGYPDACAAEDNLDNLRDAAGDASRKFPPELYIDPKNYADVARENDANRTWPLNYTDRFTNQNPTHECTCHSLIKNIEIARNRARAVAYGNGPIKGERLPQSMMYGSVWLSPLSVYAEANPRQWGGASVRGVLSIAMKRGVLPDKIQPTDYGFRHMLQGTVGQGGINQSSGPWLALSRFPEGWQDTAAAFKPNEVIFPESDEEIICLVLRGYCVSVGRDGHAVPYTHYNPTEDMVGYTDSYDIIRWDSRRRVRASVGSAFAIATVTLPDDWSKPAG